MAQSKSKDIKNAIVTMLTDLQLDGEPAFIQVKGHPRGEFDGYPSARVLPGDQTTAKGAYGQNERTPAFIIRFHVLATNTGVEFDRMYELTDLVLDTLDTEDYSGDFIPTLAAEELNASRGDWYDEDSAAGPILTCDVSVAVSYSKDN